jgi:hypothetical protein
VREYGYEYINTPIPIPSFQWEMNGIGLAKIAIGAFDMNLTLLPILCVLGIILFLSPILSV